MAKAKAVSAVDFDKQKNIIESGDTTPANSTELLSHVLWYRSVFPEVRYVFRTCDPADSGISYDAFMKGPKSGGMSSFEPTEEIRNWAILPRGQDPGADKLLNRLENGVKEALEDGSLSKLQLSFHTVDEHSPSIENLLESYTLGFAYKDGISLAEITTEAQNTVLGRKTFTTSGIKTQMNYLLETMDYMIGTQDRARGAKKSSLPASFRMLLTLKYFGGEDYGPVGFHAGNEKHMALIEATALDTKLRMATGHHSVIAGILLPLVQLNQEHSRETPELLPVHPARVPQRATRSCLLQESSPGLETQSRTIREIESMGASRHDDFNTQLIQGSSPGPQYSRHVVQQAQTPVGSIAYSQPVLDLVEQFSMQDRDVEMSQVGPSVCECQAELRSPESQRPQLRSFSTDDNMIKCAVCDGHRHAECYGYLGSAPEVLVCYSCLKEHYPEQESQLEEVQRLCLKRRVLYYFFKNRSLTSMKALTAYLNSTSKKAVETLQQLKSEKYLEGSERRKVSGKLFTFVGQEETAVDQYFNPCTGIENLLNVEPSMASIHREVQTPEFTSKPHQASTALKPSLKAPRVFHTIPGVSIVDDTSTQGSPSPQAQRTQDLSYVTPNRITAIDVDFEPGSKRKQDTDSKNVKRARISIASPWTIIKD